MLDELKSKIEKFRFRDIDVEYYYSKIDSNYSKKEAMILRNILSLVISCQICETFTLNDKDFILGELKKLNNYVAE